MKTVAFHLANGNKYLFLRGEWCRHALFPLWWSIYFFFFSFFLYSSKARGIPTHLPCFLHLSFLLTSTKLQRSFHLSVRSNKHPKQACVVCSHWRITNFVTENCNRIIIRPSTVFSTVPVISLQMTVIKLKSWKALKSIKSKVSVLN